MANTRRGNEQLLSNDYRDEDIRSFGKALYYSGRNSVDAFLEQQPQYIAVGKAAIAQELMKYGWLGPGVAGPGLVI